MRKEDKPWITSSPWVCSTGTTALCNKKRIWLLNNAHLILNCKNTYLPLTLLTYHNDSTYFIRVIVTSDEFVHV